MWGLTSRGARLGERRRPGRSYRAGLARVTVRGPAEHAIVYVEGELDFTCVDDVAAFVLQLPHPVAALDLSGLEFVDGDAVLRLREMLDRLARRHPAGTAPQLTGMRREVERVFDLVDDRRAALAMQ